jgi:integrase/recombinase XerC
MKDGAVIHVRAKRGKDRQIPGEAPLVQVLDNYLETRQARSPAAAKLNAAPHRRTRRVVAHSAAPTETELRAAHGDTGSCVPSDRPTSTPNAASSALGHGLRDVFATELANSEVSVYMLMILLGQESRARPTHALTCRAAHGCPRRPHCHPVSKVASRCPGCESMWMEPNPAL